MRVRAQYSSRVDLFKPNITPEKLTRALIDTGYDFITQDVQTHKGLLSMVPRDTGFLMDKTIGQLESIPTIENSILNLFVAYDTTYAIYNISEDVNRLDLKERLINTANRHLRMAQA